MSDSPTRRFSTASPTDQLKREESLINAYEAEEERIINVLSRKLEQLREEKIQLENTLEAESESHVNRLNREICALRRQAAQTQTQASGEHANGSTTTSDSSRFPLSGHDPTAPSVDVMLEAMRRENEQLRTRLVDTERDYVRIARLNDIYREELLELRRRLGLSVDNLVGLTPSEPFSQPMHRRSMSGVSSPSTSVGHPAVRSGTTHAVPIPSHGVPIPRPSSSIHRPVNSNSETTTPLSHSPSSMESPSPFPFSPLLSAHVPASSSMLSNGTQLTTPPSSTSAQSGGVGAPHAVSGVHALTYPSVPPPSLSSSYGSPVVSYLPQREGDGETLSRRGSAGRVRGGGVAGMEMGASGTGTGTGWGNRSRRGSVERGGRIAETGTLVPRSRSRSSADSRGGGTRKSSLDPPFFSMSYQYPFIPGHSSMPATPQTTFRWDDVLRYPLQHQPDSNTDAHVTVPVASTSTMHIQEHVPIVPSQNLRRPGSGTEDVHDEPPLRLQHVSVPALLQPEHMRPPMIDTSRAYHVGTSASPSSGPPSAGPMSAFHGSIGPMRARISPVHTDPRAAVHPYGRPQSAAGVVIARSRRDPEEGHSVRYSSSRQGSSSGASLPAPLLSIATATATTSIATPRISGLPAAAVKNMGLINPGYSASGATVVIRTDLHFNHETNVLTALCELSGRSKSDVTVVLSTNAMNRVKQVVVFAKPPRGLAEDGHGHSSGDDGGYVLRERRSGPVSRTFVVPSTTTPDDITVEMHDGLLSLKIQCPPPLSAREDDAQQIMIR
ncbi:hypothetical protein EV363DRAFT_1182372 [Boletus edulis]|nr:hypothetical protein EV363DRAFT_1182372 [Boletus edulis]